MYMYIHTYHQMLLHKVHMCCTIVTCFVFFEFEAFGERAVGAALFSFFFWFFYFYFLFPSFV